MTAQSNDAHNRVALAKDTRDVELSGLAINRDRWIAVEHVRRTRAAQERAFLESGSVVARDRVTLGRQSGPGDAGAPAVVPARNHVRSPRRHGHLLLADDHVVAERLNGRWRRWNRQLGGRHAGDGGGGFLAPQLLHHRARRTAGAEPAGLPHLAHQFCPRSRDGHEARPAGECRRGRQRCTGNVIDSCRARGGLELERGRERGEQHGKSKAKRKGRHGNLLGRRRFGRIARLGGNPANVNDITRAQSARDPAAARHP